MPLHTAKSPALMAALLEGGADPNVADQKGNTALHVATTLELVAALLTAGAASPVTAVAGRSGNMLLASAPGPPVSEAKRGEGFCDMGRRGESLSSCRNDERLNVVSKASKPSPAMSAAAVRGRRREDLGGDGTRMWS